VKEEVINMCNLIKDFYSRMGLWEDHWVSLSVRDYEHPEKYIGNKEDWDLCEKMLEEISNELNLDAKRCEGEAALYGPKLDFKLRDSLGRIWQCGTIQLDMNLPERFDISYIDKDGSKKRPIMLHRALLGSIERFIGIITEHFAGAFPLWLAPKQVDVLPVNNQYHLAYANKIKQALTKANIRAHVDARDEKLGYRIREANVKKVTYQVVIGDEEIQNKTIKVRKFGSQEQTTYTLKDFIKKLQFEIQNKVR